MLKQIFSFFKDQNSEKRNRYRFDVQYRDEIKLFINNKEQKLKEISLEGFAFFNSSKDPVQSGEVIEVSIKFQDVHLDFKAEVKNIAQGFCGCRVISRKSQFSKLIINELSPYLISFIN
jgi:hypothetical protein